MVYRALNLVTWYLPQCFLALCFQAVTCHICLHLLLIDSIFFPSTMRLVNAPFSKFLIYLLGGLIAFASLDSITHELEGHHEEHALSDCSTCHVGTADDYLAARAEYYHNLCSHKASRRTSQERFPHIRLERKRESPAPLNSKTATMFLTRKAHQYCEKR